MLAKREGLIDRSGLSHSVVLNPLGESLVRTSNVCIEFFIETDKKDKYGGTYTIIGNPKDLPLKSDSGLLLLLGNSQSEEYKYARERKLGSFKVKVGDRVIKVQLPKVRLQ